MMVSKNLILGYTLIFVLGGFIMKTVPRYLKIIHITKDTCKSHTTFCIIIAKVIRLLEGLCIERSLRI